mmetsp:Transcript_28809/g.31444  ORF Transcript_28809/g.31444 Transcript_28809/m.31444 type:complete len:118 (+) Transcript_28809:387-740(+)
MSAPVNEIWRKERKKKKLQKLTTILIQWLINVSRLYATKKRHPAIVQTLTLPTTPVNALDQANRRIVSINQSFLIILSSRPQIIFNFHFITHRIAWTELVSTLVVGAKLVLQHHILK